MGRKNRYQKDANLSVHVGFDKDKHPARANIIMDGSIAFFDENDRELEPTSLKREMSHKREKGPKSEPVKFLITRHKHSLALNNRLSTKWSLLATRTL